jgi:hypothetical protein
MKLKRNGRSLKLNSNKAVEAEKKCNTLMAPDEEQNNNVDVHEGPKKKSKRNKRLKQIVLHQSRTTVCHMCGCTPCEWEHYGLTVITIMMQAFSKKGCIQGLPV